MEITIKDQKYIFKDEISGQAEHKSGILKYLSKMMNSDINTDEIGKMLFDDDFNKTSVKLVSYMSLEPKMTEDQVLDLPSSTLMILKLKCVLQDAKSLEQIKLMFDEKKKLTQSTELTDSYTSLQTKPIDQQIRSNLRTK